MLPIQFYRRTQPLVTEFKNTAFAAYNAVNRLIFHPLAILEVISMNFYL